MNKRKKREKKNKQCEDVDICTEMNKNSRVEKKREEDELVCKACRQAIGFI
jgi:hypothetical protein